MDFTSLFSAKGPEAVSGEFASLLLGTTKWMFVLGAVLYVFFAVMVVRQEKIMGETLKTTFSPTLRLLSLFHLAAAVGVVIFFVLFL